MQLAARACACVRSARMPPEVFAPETLRSMRSTAEQLRPAHSTSGWAIRGQNTHDSGGHILGTAARAV